MAGRDSLVHRMLRTPRSRPLRKAWGRGGASSSVAAEVLEPRLMLVATPVTGAWTGGVFDQIGLYENGFWLLDLDGDRFVGDDIPAFQYGVPGDIPVTGDWNGNGITSVGVFRFTPAGAGVFVLDFNDDLTWTPADLTVGFGAIGDIPTVGNWDGAVGDEIGVFRQGLWLVDAFKNFRFGVGDSAFIWGVPGDFPIVGNWNTTTLQDGVAVYRFDGAGNGYFVLDRNEDRTFSSNRDVTFRHGVLGDLPFAGDFFGDNTDEVGVVTTAFGRQTLSIVPIPPPPVISFTAAVLQTETFAAAAAAPASGDVIEAEPPDPNSGPGDEETEPPDPLAIWSAEPDELQAALLTPPLPSAVL